MKDVKKQEVKNTIKSEKNQEYIYVKRKRLKIKWKNLLILIGFFVSLVIFVICALNIKNWLQDSKETSDQIKDVQQSVNVVEKEDSEKTEIVENDVPQSDPYWDFINMNLIDVDFTYLKSVNSNTVGWLQVGGTNINYPFVQTTDNSFYLTHTLNNTYNEAGWVFMDYRNNIVDFDKNTVIYAHGRFDNTMFGSLRNIFSSGWLDDTNNYVIKLSTESENTLWQVFSIYRIPTTSDYIQTTFASDDEFLNFGNMLLQRSAHDFSTTISATDKILTLSTCYNDDEKVVLHAKLIKREPKM